MAILFSGYVFLVLPFLLGVMLSGDADDPGTRRLIIALNLTLFGVAMVEMLRVPRRLSRLRSKTITRGGLFFVYLLLVTFWFDQGMKGPGSVEQMKSLLGLLVWLAPAATLLVLDGPADLLVAKRVARMSLFGISASVYASFLAPSVGFTFGESLEYGAGLARYFGPLGDQVGYVTVLGIALGLVRRNYAECAFHVGALLITGTRGAMLTLIAAGIVYLALPFFDGAARRWASRRLMPATILAGVVAAIVVMSFGHVALERFANADILGTGLATRSASMQLGVEVFLLHPVMGAGYNGFTEAALSLGPEALFERFIYAYVSNASNQFIQIAVEGGIVGLVLFGLLLRAAIGDAWLAHRAARADMRGLAETIFIWLCAVLVGNQGAVWLLPHSLPGLFFFGLATLGSRLAAVAVPVPAELARREHIAAPALATR